MEYKAFKRVGFGIAGENFNVGVETEGKDYPEINLIGRINYRYFGAVLYTKIYF